MISKFFAFLKENFKPFKNKRWEKVIIYKSKDTVTPSQTFKQFRDPHIARLVRQKRFWPQPMFILIFTLIIFLQYFSYIYNDL
uniref:Uncharacterized protein n=1 Tax=Heterorhabditis bacteriophora TaxID=37862 RepID=A0A1I7WXF7_HETBA